MVAAGMRIEHPIYGKGVVETVFGGYVLVSFITGSKTVPTLEVTELSAAVAV